MLLLGGFVDTTCANLKRHFQRCESCARIDVSGRHRERFARPLHLHRLTASVTRNASFAKGELERQVDRNSANLRDSKSAYAFRPDPIISAWYDNRCLQINRQVCGGWIIFATAVYLSTVTEEFDAHI